MSISSPIWFARCPATRLLRTWRFSRHGPKLYRNRGSPSAAAQALFADVTVASGIAPIPARDGTDHPRLQCDLLPDVFWQTTWSDRLWCNLPRDVADEAVLRGVRPTINSVARRPIWGGLRRLEWRRPVRPFRDAPARRNEYFFAGDRDGQFRDRPPFGLGCPACLHGIRRGGARRSNTTAISIWCGQWPH